MNAASFLKRWLRKGTELESGDEDRFDHFGIQPRDLFEYNEEQLDECVALLKPSLAVLVVSRIT